MSVKISYNLCLEIRHCSNNIPPFNAAASTSSEYKFKLLVLKFANKLSFFLLGSWYLDLKTHFQSP